MNISRSILSIAACLTLIASAEASTTVNFIEPEKYADMPFSQFDRDRVKAAFVEHFNVLGAKLPAGQDLKIDITDIDLAGRIEPFATRTMDLRVLRGRADWPRMTLRYSIEADGKVIKSGDADIADMNYLSGYSSQYTGELLRYEKKMLDNWFKKSVLVPGR